MMIAYKDIEYFHTLYKKFSIKDVRKGIIDIFNTTVIPKLPEMKLTFKSNHLFVYEIEINPWIVETTIDLAKGGYEYSQKIRSDTSRAVLCKVSFPEWVGFSGGWCFFSKEDIYEAASDIAYHSIRFIHALPLMLEGILIPDILLSERIVLNIENEKLFEKVNSIIELNREKINSALNSQSLIDEMLELGIVLIEQGRTWYEVAVIFEVIGNNLLDDDIEDQSKLMSKVSDEWHKRKVLLSE